MYTYTRVSGNPTGGEPITVQLPLYSWPQDWAMSRDKKHNQLSAGIVWLTRTDTTGGSEYARIDLAPANNLYQNAEIEPNLWAPSRKGFNSARTLYTTVVREDSAGVEPTVQIPIICDVRLKCVEDTNIPNAILQQVVLDTLALWVSGSDLTAEIGRTRKGIIVPPGVSG